VAGELPKRILVYGTTGSGKSTLASRLALTAGLPYHSLDDLTFEANWKPVPTERQRAIMAELAAGEAWVFDTAYSAWIDVVLERAELIVALDYPPPLIFLRLLRRTIRRVVSQQPICNGNRETLRGTLSRDSILVWFFKSYKRKRTRIRGWKVEPPCGLVVFEKPWEAEAWLRRI
jgi:adenylate kinase family enzyme